MTGNHSDWLAVARVSFGGTCLAALTLFGSVAAGCNELRPRAASRMAETPDLDAADGDHGWSSAAARPDGDARRSMQRWAIENGCGRTWSASGDAGLTTGLLLAASMCAPGLKPLRPAPFEVSLDARDRTLVPFSFESSSVCFRAIAVSSVDGIELSILKDDDLISGAFSTDKVVVVPPEGPVCLRDAQGLRLALRNPVYRTSSPGLARVATNVWFAQGE